MDLSKGEVRAAGSHVLAPLELRERRPHIQRHQGKDGEVSGSVPPSPGPREPRGPLPTWLQDLFLSVSPPFLLTFIQVLFLFFACKEMLWDSGMGRRRLSSCMT